MSKQCRYEFKVGDPVRFLNQPRSCPLAPPLEGATGTVENVREYDIYEDYRVRCDVRDKRGLAYYVLCYRDELELIG